VRRTASPNGQSCKTKKAEAAIAARLAIELLSLGSAHWRHSLIDLQLDQAADTTIFVLSVLFVVWFRRARNKAERHGYRQRRARGRAFWGWIVPIVNSGFRSRPWVTSDRRSESVLAVVVVLLEVLEQTGPGRLPCEQFPGCVGCSWAVHADEVA